MATKTKILAIGTRVKVICIIDDQPYEWKRKYLGKIGVIIYRYPENGDLTTVFFNHNNQDDFFPEELKPV